MKAQDPLRIARIREVAATFRDVATLPAMREHAGFRYFPEWSCTWASFALGHILEELEPDAGWHLVNSYPSVERGGHDWLEDRSGLAVDVTADQFHDASWYVGALPMPHSGHWLPTKRIALSDADDAHLSALATVRANWPQSRCAWTQTED